MSHETNGKPMRLSGAALSSNVESLGKPPNSLFCFLESTCTADGRMDGSSCSCLPSFTVRTRPRANPNVLHFLHCSWIPTVFPLALMSLDIPAFGHWLAGDTVLVLYRVVGRLQLSFSALNWVHFVLASFPLQWLTGSAAECRLGNRFSLPTLAAGLVPIWLPERRDSLREPSLPLSWDVGHSQERQTPDTPAKPTRSLPSPPGRHLQRMAFGFPSDKQ
ncbi:hypothetical protein B0T26DRAFT_233415 [Lasiosphaeria miniovina]|uniref:Uncharacterized protein n=1 Tax=Lasiosphaeria miniovina TaxID=1954250 RepID=A0AA40AVL9_9PEZI|nr:uncharacterized protein B0T26DRAFT_233415 [Lasiosphaeria miniovina]KAK0722791.1 hypothetical protein B0T26DRAFT_233415 [Lasiosphaeria miniovina]